MGKIDPLEGKIVVVDAKSQFIVHSEKITSPEYAHQGYIQVYSLPHGILSVENYERIVIVAVGDIYGR